MEDRVWKKLISDYVAHSKDWNKSGLFDILNDICEYVTLVQLMDKFGNVSHAVSISGTWIFDLND